MKEIIISVFMSIFSMFSVDISDSVEYNVQAQDLGVSQIKDLESGNIFVAIKGGKRSIFEAVAILPSSASAWDLNEGKLVLFSNVDQRVLVIDESH